MNQEERKYEAMFSQAQRQMDANTDKWASIPAIVRYKNELDAYLQSIKEKDQEASGQTRGVTLTKDELKEQLSVKTAILCGAMYAFASESGNQELATQSAFSASALKRLPDKEMAQRVDALVKLVRANLAALADQGVTEEQVVEVNTSLDDYSEMVGLPRTLTIQASTAGKELDQLIKEANTMLKEQLDKAMLRFQLTDPAFYEGYLHARKLVD